MILRLGHSDSCASVQSHFGLQKPKLTSSQSNSAYPAAQVKDLEMQQDGTQRAIETKQQQLKPLEAEVRARSRQVTQKTAWRFLPLGPKSKVPEYSRVQRRCHGKCECGLQRMATVLK